MARFCLIPESVQKFKKALIDRELDPFEMSKMSSDERRKLISKYVGEEHAVNVNSLYESKLLLKNQKAGYQAWAKKVSGLTPEAKRDILSKIEKLDKVLNPKEEQAFLHDLASTKLGTNVSEGEAKQIFNLSEKVKETRTKMSENNTFKTEEERLDYGRAKVALINYINELKLVNNRLSIKESLQPKNYIKVASGIAGEAKSIKSSMDNSAIFRQGWKTLFTNPLTWQKNARKTFSDIYRTFGGKKVADELSADLLSRPNYERYAKAKLAIGTIEEAFPGSVAEKIPLLGRAYKASENAYTGFLHRQRADIFDKYLDIAQKSGINIDDVKEIAPIASMVNSLTGRGNLGRLEGSAANELNNIFFSPRNVKSQFDTLGHIFTGAGGSNFVRKQAAVNLLKVISGTAAVLGIASVVKPGSVEWDPRSSDFGKIKVGNTRFDVSGGMSSLVVLAARVLPLLIGQESQTKSTTTGELTPLNSGKFGSKTGKDVFYDFFSNKAAPVASVFLSLLEGQDFNGDKPTIQNNIKNLFVPIGYGTYEDLNKDPNAPNKVLAMILDGLGIGVNTYLPKPKKEQTWLDKPTIQQKAFLDKVGSEKFQEANKVFNIRYESWKKEAEKNETYAKLDKEKKQSVDQDARQRIQDGVFKEYGFKYQTPKRTPQDNQLDKELEKVKPKPISQAILDKIIPPAYASGEEAPIDPEIKQGIVDSIINSLKSLFGDSPEVKNTRKVKGNPADMKLTVGKSKNFVNENNKQEVQQVGNSEKAPEISISSNGQVDYNKIPRDTNYKEGRQGFNPPQPPADIANIIKKYFGADSGVATLVAAAENAQFDPRRPDNVNQSDGSRDRGIFQINSNTFNGLMQRQGDILRQHGINSFEDMYDPDKNAFTAKLIREGSKQANPKTNGWGGWYGWQDTGYNINNGWYSAPKRIKYELAKK